MAFKQSVWETNSYYEKAGNGSLDTNHPGIKLLVSLAKDKKEILDLGCGEGTRLSLISKKGTGVDISTKAINFAKKKFSNLNFFMGNLEELRFKDSSFDLVYSAYVFEHLTDPERVIGEARRVLKIDGDLVIICPNYGSPNRASPPFKKSRINKLIAGFLKDFIYLFSKVDKLNWNRVTPIATSRLYESDWDVTIEPYSLTLEKYLKTIGFKIVRNIQTWNYELGDAKFHQRIFRFLGKNGIYPFSYWSPHIVIQARKI